MCIEQDSSLAATGERKINKIQFSPSSVFTWVRQGLSADNHNSEKNMAGVFFF